MKNVSQAGRLEWKREGVRNASSSAPLLKKKIWKKAFSAMI